MSGVCNIVPDQEIRPQGQTMKEELAKESPLEALMEKIRSKANHYKSWNDMAKAFRVALVEKRHLMDNTERCQLQKCLDTIQKSIKVTSLQSMVERLESITRQQGLKFTALMNGTDCFISSDMFYVEVLLQETSGEVKDVKITHHGDPVSCPELTKVLSMGDFSDFTRHLEGLSSIYQLNADKKQKTKAYLALHALETDLSSLSQIQSSINEPSNLVHKSPVGILQPRKGGHPMKLTYFISPYDLLDIEAKTSIPLTVDVVLERQLGHSVTVCIESSTAHKLQTTSLISISKTAEGKSLPSFAALSNLNSTTLPACFVMKLPSPVPMALSFIKRIQGVTSIECADLTNTQPLLSLITKETSNGKLDCRMNQGLYVTLPDQQHCYFLNSSTELQGVLVSSIPFTHPTHVPQILVFLRQQLLFNTVVGSCVRPSSKQDAESALMFEVTALSLNHISVSFEHPLEESLATVDLDLRDVTNVKCKIYTISSYSPICTDEYASKVMQRCLSIPVTMRAVIRKAQGQQYQVRPSSQGDMYYTPVSGSGGLPYLSQLPSYGGGTNGSTGFGGSDFATLASKIGSKGSECAASPASEEIGGDDKMDMVDQNASGQGYSVSTSHSQSSEMSLDVSSLQSSPNIPQSLSNRDSVNTDINVKPKLSDSSNCLLDNLLSLPADGNTQSFQQGKNANAMLMSMLSDLPAANSPTSFPFVPQSSNNKPRKQRKRKSVGEVTSPGRSTATKSPKRKLSEDDSGKDLPAPDVESGDSATLPFDLAPNLVSLPHGGFDASGSSRTDITVKQEPGGESASTGASSSDLYSGNESYPQQLCTSPISVDNDLSAASDSSTNYASSSMPENSQSKMPSTFGPIVSDPLDFCSELLVDNKGSFGETSEQGDMDIDKCDASAFGVDLNTALMSSKLVSGDKSNPSKRPKRGSVEEIQDQSSETVDEPEDPAKSSDDANPPNDQSDDSLSDEKPNKESLTLSVQKKPSNFSSSSSSASTNIGTSFKIAKSGENNLKISKLEGKLRQKEGRRSSSASDDTADSLAVKRKGDLKKERKRKRAESFDNLDKAVLRPLHVGLESSLMPPPTHSTVSMDDSMIVTVSSSTADLQPLRPITLNVKPLTPTPSSQLSPTKSPVPTSKKQGPAITTSKTNTECSSPTTKEPSTKAGKPVVKPTSPRHSSQLASSSRWVATSESDTTATSTSTKSTTSSPSTKIPAKHKQGNLTRSVSISPSPSNSSSSSTNPHTGTANSSVSSFAKSPKGTPLKLKHLNLPASTTITPITSKVSSSSLNVGSHNVLSSPPSSANSLSITPTNSQSGTSNKLFHQTGNSGKGNKSAVRSKKCSLSTVIDKLIVSASNAQHITTDNCARPDFPAVKSDAVVDRKDARPEKRESISTKESLRDAAGGNAKVSDSKPKYSSSDQFTVKQSSQGIKLTVTKTRSSDAHSKSKGRSQSKASTAVMSGISPTGVKPSGTAGSGYKAVAMMQGMKTKNAGSSSVTPATRVPGTPSQVKPSFPQKVPSSSPSPITTSTPSRLSNSVSPSKVCSKSVNNSIQSKSGTSVKSIPEKAKTVNKLADKVPSGVFETHMMSIMPPPLNKSVSDQNRTSSGSTPKRSDESPFRHSPRRTPTRESLTEESESEKAFRQLQMKSDPAYDARVTASTPQPDLSLSLAETATCKYDFEEKIQRVSSAIDSKSCRSPLSPITPCDDSDDCQRTSTAVHSTSTTVESQEVSRGNGKSDLISGLKIDPTSNAPYFDSSFVPQPNASKAVKLKKQSADSDDNSSPEDGLIIDCPSTPRVQKSPERKPTHSISPKTIHMPVPTSVTEEKSEKPVLSPNMNAKSPFHHSPVLKSPLQVVTPPSNHSVSSSISRPSPYVIDDDLMDEALVGLGK